MEENIQRELTIPYSVIDSAALKSKRPVNLFPYKIKNRENFYHRNHPENIHPASPFYKKYWREHLHKCIEGIWVNDEGTWVYMMPKLFSHINYGLITDKKRKLIVPELCDNEWIIFTYILCVDGFSGFEGDEKYTCNFLVGRLEKGEELDEVEMMGVSDFCKKADGTYKKFVNPWEYLTRTYLLDDPPSAPLGLPLYENGLHDGMILSARSTRKSVCIFNGDFKHEFLFGATKRIEEIKDGSLNFRRLFAMGSGDARQMNRSINNLRASYYAQPGKFQFKSIGGVKGKKKNVQGAFFKRIQGMWGVGGEIKHIVPGKGIGNPEVQGSSLQMVAFKPDTVTVGAGDRIAGIYYEEFGFMGDLAEAVYTANRDSLRSEGEIVGRAFYLGTGGQMEKIKKPKHMFENPEAYEIFGIPNYWKKNKNKKIGLFIPYYYALSKYKDENGNTKLEEAWNAVVKIREHYRDKKGSVAYNSHVMFNPIEPDEMLRPSYGGYMPKQEAAQRLNLIEAEDLFRKKAMIGTLEYDPREPYGVRFDLDLTGTLKPIKRWNVDVEHIDPRGAFIMYEPPPLNIPEGLYYALIDPVKESKDVLNERGMSFFSVLIYKNSFVGGSEEALYDTIVAEWCGRYERLDENFDYIVRMIKFYNAKGFPEMQDVGFVEYCGRKKLYGLLEGDSMHMELAINPGAKRNYYKVGTKMDGRKKIWCLQRVKDWLLDVQEYDINGLPVKRVLDTIYSPLLLDEIVNYNEDDNFDHVSSLLLLIFLLGKLNSLEVPLPEIKEYDPWEEYSRLEEELRNSIVEPKRRCKFLMR